MSAAVAETGGWPANPRWLPLWAWDLGLAVAVAVVGLLPSGHQPRWGYPAAFVGGLVLVARRRWPHAVLVATFPALIGGLGTIAVGAALYALGRARPDSRALAPWLASTIVLNIAMVVYRDYEYGLGPARWGDWVITVLVVVLITGGPAAAGALAATRMRLAASLAALRATEADRDAAVAARVRAEERNRIAREVHDIVGHYAALIAVQASALEATAPDPRTRDTAIRLRELSSDSLEEMRSAVAMWRRTDDGPLADGDAVGAEIPQETSGAGVPQDWLARVLEPAVVARESGVEVHIDQSAELPESMSEAALQLLRRALQEGVTNALRHCPGTPVSIALSAAEGAGVQVEVRNPCETGATATSGASQRGEGGNGLAGLGERVRQLGGTISAGRTNGEGGRAEWLLRVRLPQPG